MDSFRTTLWKRTRTTAKDDKKIYVIGHRNPDTDSVVSAHAYASLKRSMGEDGCIAARAGKITPQTEYIFNRFQVPIPEFIPDLVPRVSYYYNPDVQTITNDVSLWDAMFLLQSSENQGLPVIDDDGCYHSILHYSYFAKKLVEINNPRQKTAIYTSVNLLASVLDAQKLVVANGAELKKSPITVAASEFETFKTILGTHIPKTPSSSPATARMCSSM